MHVHAVCCVRGTPLCSATKPCTAAGSSSPSRSCDREVSPTPLSRSPASTCLASSTEMRPSPSSLHSSLSFASTVSIGNENL
eukprot:scaffold61238_cov64-Phaeocystis_antarctica.AAC.13